MRAKKHLGQHFLTSKKVLSDMLDAAQVSATDTILEIGPGKGVLTKELLKRGATVIAIETDPDMVNILRDTFSEALERAQLVLIEADVRTVAIARNVPSPYKLVANIPYYITGEILRSFLTCTSQPTSITVLTQKEVAERIARSTKESILSLSIKIYGTPRYVGTVPARYFTPQPKVDSAILYISDISQGAFVDITPDRFFKLVKAGFSSKRKKLINNLSGFGNKEKLLVTLTRLGISKDIRAEDLPISDWIQLAKAISP